MEPSVEVKELIDHKNSIYKDIYELEARIKSLKVEISDTNKKFSQLATTIGLETGTHHLIVTVNESVVFVNYMQIHITTPNHRQRNYPPYLRQPYPSIYQTSLLYPAFLIHI